MATDPNAPQDPPTVEDPSPNAAPEQPAPPAAKESGPPPATEPAPAVVSDPNAPPDVKAWTEDPTQLPPNAPLSGAPDNVGNAGGTALQPPEAADAGAVGDPHAVAPTTDETVDGDGKAIIVPSGAAATPNTPPWTKAENALVAPASAAAGSGDPGLTDPQSLVDARKGTTSDPATRVADNAVTTDEETNTTLAGDTHPDTVPPDVNDGVKPSDGGPAAYPFPVQGDVEVGLIDRSVLDGEKMEPIYEGDFVVLGTHELVPERLVGAEAAVLDAPTILCNCDWAPRTHEHIHPTAGITVQTRDDANARLVIPLAAIARVLRGGRISR